MTKIYCDSADYKIIKKYNKYNFSKRIHNQSKFNEIIGCKELQRLFKKNPKNL